MKRWIGAGLLAATLTVTGCASNGYYGRNYRYDRDYRYRYYRDHDDRHRDYDRDDWRYR
jgi:hypothetical protein